MTSGQSTRDWRMRACERRPASASRHRCHRGACGRRLAPVSPAPHIALWGLRLHSYKLCMWAPLLQRYLPLFLHVKHDYADSLFDPPPFGTRSRGDLAVGQGQANRLDTSKAASALAAPGLEVHLFASDTVVATDSFEITFCYIGNRAAIASAVGTVSVSFIRYLCPVPYHCVAFINCDSYDNETIYDDETTGHGHRRDLLQGTRPRSACCVVPGTPGRASRRRPNLRDVYRRRIRSRGANGLVHLPRGYDVFWSRFTLFHDQLPVRRPSICTRFQRMKS